MNQYIILTIMNFALAITGLGLVALGLRGLLKPRPFLIRAMWMIGPLFLAVLVSLIPSLTVSTGGGGFSDGLSQLMPVTVSLALLFILAVIFLGQFGTYLIIGINQEDLREVILFALARLDIPHLEMLTRLHLPMHNADLQVLGGLFGTAQIRIRPRNNAVLLDAIASEMGEIFAESKQHAVLLPSIVNLVFGALLLGSAVTLTLMAIR